MWWFRCWLFIWFDLRVVSSTCLLIVCVWFEMNQFFYMPCDCSHLIWGWPVVLFFLTLYLFDFRVPSCFTCQEWWMESTRELRYTTCVASSLSWNSALWSGGALTPTFWLTGIVTGDCPSGHLLVLVIFFKWLLLFGFNRTEGMSVGKEVEEFVWRVVI